MRRTDSLLALALCLTPAVLAQNKQAPAGPGEIYHINLTKAVPGKAAALMNSLKVQDPKAPMKGHYLVLRHQDGEAWDFATLEHLGTKATVDTVGTGTPVDPATRDLRAWHDDTFVVGPSWADFAKAMGLGGTPASTAGSVYRVSTYRAAPGHREQLEKLLRAPNGSGETAAGTVVLTHLEGGAWNFLVIDRWNSWQDFATNENNGRAQLAKGTGGWFDVREHIDTHSDTLTDRVAP